MLQETWRMKRKYFGSILLKLSKQSSNILINQQTSASQGTLFQPNEIYTVQYVVHSDICKCLGTEGKNVPCSDVSVMLFNPLLLHQNSVQVPLQTNVDDQLIKSKKSVLKCSKRVLFSAFLSHTVELLGYTFSGIAEFY